MNPKVTNVILKLNVVGKLEDPIKSFNTIQERRSQRKKSTFSRSSQSIANQLKTFQETVKENGQNKSDFSIDESLKKIEISEDSKDKNNLSLSKEGQEIQKSSENEVAELKSKLSESKQELESLKKQLGSLKDKMINDSSPDTRVASSSKWCCFW